ncbi:hypothetical protein GCM10009736_37850 [Actinomadura bangladeshensis]
MATTASVNRTSRSGSREITRDIPEILLTPPTRPSAKSCCRPKRAERRHQQHPFT